MTTTRSRTAACTGTTATRTRTPAMDASSVAGTSSRPSKVPRERATPTRRWACTRTSAPKASAPSTPGSRFETRRVTGSRAGRACKSGPRARPTPRRAPSVFQHQDVGGVRSPALPTPSTPRSCPRWAAGRTTRATCFGAARRSTRSARASATGDEGSRSRRLATPPTPSPNSRPLAWAAVEAAVAPQRPTARSTATRCRFGWRTSRSPTCVSPPSRWA